MSTVAVWARWKKMKIVRNYNAGIIVESNGKPTGRRNRISGNRLAGIQVGGDGSGVFEHNDLRDNGKGAWSIAAAALPNVTRNDNQE